MAGNENDDPNTLDENNPDTSLAHFNKKQAELRGFKNKDEFLKAQKAQALAELQQRQQLFDTIRSRPWDERRRALGGTLEKIVHLAELNMESLAGYVIMQYLMFAFRLLSQGQYTEDNAIYEAAKKMGCAYDGKQVIYKLKVGADNKTWEVDLDSPYMPGEKPPLHAIIANGYVPPANPIDSLAKEWYRFVEQQAGANMLQTDELIQTYGLKLANEVKSAAAKSSAGMGHDMVGAKLLNRPTKT